MPYDIRRKDGTIIKGVPDNITPDQIKATVMGDEKANEPSWGEAFTASAGRVPVNIGRNVANAVGMEGYSDKDLEESERLDKTLMDTPGSGWGQLAGELGTFAAGGIAGKAAMGAGNAARLGRAMEKAGRIKSSAAIGAGAGLATSTPSTRGESLGYGAAGGAIGGGLTRAAARFRKGMDGKDAAKEYMARFDEDFMPVAQYAKKGSLLRQVYRDVFPSVPIAGKTAQAQEAAVFNHMRGKALEKAVPKGQTMHSTDVQVPGDFSAGMKTLDDAFQQGWDAIKGFNVNPVARTASKKPKYESLARLMDDTVDSIPGIKKKELQIIRRKLINARDAKGNISTDVLMQVRNELADSVRAGSKVLKNAADGGSRLVDGLTDDIMKMAGPANARKWRAAKAAHPKQQILERISSGNEHWQPKDWAKAAAAQAKPKTGSQTGGLSQEDAQIAYEALGKEIGEPGFWRMAATLSVGSSVGGGLLFGPVGAIAAPLLMVGIPKVALTKVVQRALTGHTGAQKAFQKILLQHPEAAEAMAKNVAALSGSQASTGN